MAWPRRKQSVTDVPAVAGKASLGKPAGVIARTILIFIISQLLAVFLVELVYGAIRPGSHANLDSSITAQFFYILIAEGAAAWFVIKLVKKRGLSLAVIGFGRRPRKSDLLKAALGFVVFYALLIVAGIIISIFSPDLTNQQQNIGFNNINNNIENYLAFISLVIIPPLGEETLIRGYLYSGLRRWWRFWPALLVTSLLFGAAHLEFGNGGPLVWGAAIDTFLLSVVLVYLRENTGVLYAGILVHALNNLIAFGVHFK